MVSKTKFLLNDKLKIQDLSDFVFRRNQFSEFSVAEKILEKTQKSHDRLMALVAKGTPIYGVTTGFGDSCTHYVDQTRAVQLQHNLIQYLSCGQGDLLSPEASRAMFLIRLNSLAQGYSAVSRELISHMVLLLQNDLVPAVPQEGSLGASGDLVPLAYLGQLVQGTGQCFYQGQLVATADVFKDLKITPYVLKPKEGLAIVNGTSTMAGVMLVNLKLTEDLIRICELATAWQCLVLQGKREAFGFFINEVAKTNPGQALAARNIRKFLDAENYSPNRGQEVQVGDFKTEDFVQDRYSLRCVPQILGPIRENLAQSWLHFEHEINSVTDNPVIDPEGNLEMGGNFYGGYLCQAMDFTKINLAHMADLMDRQVMMLIDQKSNRGLPDNLVDIANLSPQEANIHHGLKGVHQTVSAITSEVIQKSIPSGIFSRSSESHNQDKVSLGMSAAVSCGEMLKGVYKIAAMQLVCLAQAIDLKKIHLKGSESQTLYNKIRQHVHFVNGDRALGAEIYNLTEDLKRTALNG